MNDSRHAEMITVVLNEVKNFQKICLDSNPKKEVVETNRGFYTKPDKIEIEIESPYNYFGDRGFVDLVVYEEYENCNTLELYEMKTTLEDIGETLRQIHRAEMFFLKARDKINGIPIRNYVKTWVNGHLIFLNTLKNLEIFEKNIELFSEAKIFISIINNGERIALPLFSNKLLKQTIEEILLKNKKRRHFNEY